MVRVGAHLVKNDNEARGLQPFVRLVHPSSLCYAEVSVFGASVYDWRVGRTQMLHLAQSGDGLLKPYEGSVTVSWPQWGSNGNFENHGFANKVWWTVESTIDKPDPSVTLLLKSNDETKKLGLLNDFELRHTIKLGPETLECILSVKNTGDKPLDFTGGHRCFWLVPDIYESRASGFGALDYFDAIKGSPIPATLDDVVGVYKEPVERIYLQKEKKTMMVSPVAASADLVLFVEQENYPETIICNLHNTKENCSLSENYKSYIGLQPAAATKAVTLCSGEEWTAKMKCLAQKFDLTEDEDKPPGD